VTDLRQSVCREAFSVGCTAGYDRYLADAPPEGCWKVGRHDDYAGGWAWTTREAASAFLTSEAFATAFPGRDPAEFAVYRLELPTGWDVDVYGPNPKDGVHNLINDARIVGRADVALRGRSV
jgi:hypothetical protein